MGCTNLNNNENTNTMHAKDNLKAILAKIIE